jgi:putative phosphoesterase
LLIGVLSDTHLLGKPVPDHIIEVLSGSDLILHAGDILEMRIIDQLSRVAPTYAVKGNMDVAEVQHLLPARRVIEAGEFRIGLTHGHGPPGGMARRVQAEFDGVDCIVFGHTHNSHVEELDGILFFNPGSPTDRVFASRNTVGFLEVADIITPRIVDITAPPD